MQPSPAQNCHRSSRCQELGFTLIKLIVLNLSREIMMPRRINFPPSIERHSHLACSMLASMIISATFTARNNHDCVPCSTKPAHFCQHRKVQASPLTKWISWVVYGHVWLIQFINMEKFEAKSHEKLFVRWFHSLGGSRPLASSVLPSSERGLKLKPEVDE